MHGAVTSGDSLGGEMGLDYKSSINTAVYRYFQDAVWWFSAAAYCWKSGSTVSMVAICAIYVICNQYGMNGCTSREGREVQIVITSWAYDTYLELKHTHIFSDDDYWNVIRPRVMRLANYPNDVMFQGLGKQWSPAEAPPGSQLSGGFKMKWHNLGSGRVDLRLLVAVVGSEVFLCEAYVKNSPQVDRRMQMRFQMHLQRIQGGIYTEKGRLK